MRLPTYVTLVIGCIATAASAQEVSLGEMKELCRVSFTASTQAGPMKGDLAVCRLESKERSDVSQCVVSVYEKYWGPNILLVLNQAHSPIMEKKGDRVSILYTSGANTTCVTEFSISGSVPKFTSTETIAWNDGGTYRTSTSFPQYAPLLAERDKPDHTPKPKPSGAAQR